MTGSSDLWIVNPAAQQASGGWIDDVLKDRAEERGLGHKTPLAAQFPRQRVEVIRGPDAAARLDELFYARGWTDGLPVCPPTVGRVRATVQAGCRSAAEVLGEVEPLKGLASVEKVAANAVMAGCRPEHFPVVLAAVEAILDPAFNMRGVQTTDENVAPLVVVNGPIRLRLDINSGYGVLGPGWRANATIGRAVRLVMHNLGGGWPGAVSLAGLGQAARYTCCMGENEEQSPWPPLHTENGLDAGDSAVTVMRAETVVNVTGGLEEVASVMGTACSAFGAMWGGRPTVLLAPLLAAELARRGMTKRDVRAYLFETGRWDAEAWRSSYLYRTIAGPDRWPAWVREAAVHGRVPVVASPDDIVLVVTGGDMPITQNAYCPSWGFPPACFSRRIEEPPGRPSGPSPEAG